MAEIASGCPKIKELDISYCYEISDRSLAVIGSHCPNVNMLKRNLMNWLDPSQHVGIVPFEYLNACPQDGDSEAAAISKFMPRLLHLEVRFLKLTAKGLALISQGCEDLEYVDLSGCANVTSRDIANASLNLKKLKTMKKPNFYIPRSVFHTERYGHWSLYDERFQTDVFRIWADKQDASSSWWHDDILLMRRYVSLFDAYIFVYPFCVEPRFWRWCLYQKLYLMFLLFYIYYFPKVKVSLEFRSTQHFAAALLFWHFFVHCFEEIWFD